MPLTSLAAWKMVKLPSGRGPEAGPPAPCHRLGCSRAPPPHAPISPLLATQVSRSCGCTTTTWRRCQRSTRPTSSFSSSTRTASPRSPPTISSRRPRWRDSSCRGAPHRRTIAPPHRRRTAPPHRRPRYPRHPRHLLLALASPLATYLSTEHPPHPPHPPHPSYPPYPPYPARPAQVHAGGRARLAGQLRQPFDPTAAGQQADSNPAPDPNLTLPLTLS